MKLKILTVLVVATISGLVSYFSYTAGKIDASVEWQTCIMESISKQDAIWCYYE